jgi:hypothetical protein
LEVIQCIKSVAERKPKVYIHLANNSL